MLYLFTAIGLFNLAFLTLLKLLFLPLVISGMYTVIWEDTVKKKTQKTEYESALPPTFLSATAFQGEAFIFYVVTVSSL